MLTVEHVTKRYGSFTALEDISLQFTAGVYGLLAPNGAGKTTLIKMLTTLLFPTSGQILWEGEDIHALDEEYRGLLGYLPQEFGYYPGYTPRQFLRYVAALQCIPRKEADGRISKLLELVGLSDKADAYPSQLSGGQKQRVAIARALASDPEVLLSDEATSALDPETTQSILRLLKEVNRALGVTILIITHEMQVIKEICSQVYVMEGGRIVEQGDVFQVFAVPRQAVTRRFVDSTSHLSRIQELLDDPARPIKLNPGDYLFRLNYLERSTSEALISNISRRFELDVNILLGSIELIDGNPLGGLVVVAGGGHDKIAAAAEYLSKRNVQVEVISHG